MAHIQLISIVEPMSDEGIIWRLPYAFPIIIRQLEKSKHTYDIIDTHLHKKTRKDIIEFIKKSKSNIFGISSYSEGYNFVKIITKEIKKKNKDAVVIVGGILAKSGDVLFEQTEVDIVVTCPEGEYVLPEILDVLDLNTNDFSSLKGFSYRSKSNSQVINLPPRPIMNNKEYQKTEIPAYEVFDNEIFQIIDYLNTIEDMPVKGFPLLTTRGCPFKCTFCGHMYGRRFLRKNWDNFFKHIDFLLERYSVTGFFSNDTNLFLNEKDVEEYCKRYRDGNYSFKIAAEMRPTFGDYQMFKRLKDHGVLVLLIGYESGSQIMLDNMKKQTDIKQVFQIIKDAVKADIILHGNFIFGTPGENEKTVKETRNFMFELEKLYEKQKEVLKNKGMIGASGYGWSIVIPTPPSELFSLAIDSGAIKDVDSYLSSLDREDYSLEYIKSHIRHSGGDVNLSEFESKSTLINYVKYSINIVKLKLLLYKRKEIKSNIIPIQKKIFEIIVSYTKFLISKHKHRKKK